MQSIYKFTMAAALGVACAGAAHAQYDPARSGPVDTVGSNPNPLMYVSQNLARNMTATYRYLDDVYSLGTASPARLQLVPDPLGSGRKVFYHTVYANDPLVSGGSRTEVALKYDYTISGVRWYAFSMMFPSDWQFHPSPTVVAQVNTSQKTLAVPPPVAVVASGQDLNIELHSNYRSTTSTSADPATRANTAEGLVRAAKIETNKWYCFVMRADWSYTAGVGSMQIWLNGNLAYESVNEYNAYDTWLGNYPKVGLYLPGVMQVPVRSIYTDFIYTGGSASTYETMAAMTPCGTAPSATPAVIR